MKMRMMVCFHFMHVSCNLYTGSKFGVPEPLVLVNKKWFNSVIYLKTSHHFGTLYHHVTSS
jgi:hypothetical protein